MRKHSGVWSHRTVPDLSDGEERVEYGYESIKYFCKDYPYLGDPDDVNRSMMKA